MNSTTTNNNPPMRVLHPKPNNSNNGFHLFDLLVLFLSLLCLSLTFDYSGDYTMDSIQFIPIDTNLNTYKNGIAPDQSERVPQPIITDLDGDGANELVLVTREPKLKLYRYRAVTTAANKHYIDNNDDTDIDESDYTDPTATIPSNSLDLLGSVDLSLGNLALLRGRQVLALATGYNTEYNDNTNRQQIIVIVTESYQIQVYNSELELLWSRTIAIDFTAHYLTAVSIVINSHSMRLNDSGVIIIGSKLQPRTELYNYQLHRDKTTTINSDGSEFHSDNPHSNNQYTAADTDSDNNNGESESLLHDGSEHQINRESHYNYYAFDSITGADRWHHLSSDFIVDNSAADILHPQHDIHSGEVDWRVYRNSIIMNALPHYYSTDLDTKLDLAHFEKQIGNRKKPNNNNNINTGSTASTALFTNDLSIRLRPHSALEHIQKPNAIVAHLRDGIEIIHLYTGKPLCQLSLKLGQLHFDLNSDGIIDHIQTLSPVQSFITDSNHLSPFIRIRSIKSQSSSSAAAAAAAKSNCLAVITSGIPAVNQLYNTSLCANSNSLGLLLNLQQSQSQSAQSRRHSINRQSAYHSDSSSIVNRAALHIQKAQADSQLLFAAPIVIPQLSSNSKSSTNTVNSNKRYRSIFFSSSGSVIGLNSDGSISFSSNTIANWMIEPELPNTNNGEGTIITDPDPSTPLTSNQALIANLARSISFIPSINGYSMNSNSELIDHLLVLGENAAVLLSAINGRYITSITLNDLSILSPVIGDINNDNLNDWILITSTGYYIILIQSNKGNPLLTILSSIMCCIIIALITNKIIQSISMKKKSRKRSAAPVQYNSINNNYSMDKIK